MISCCDIIIKPINYILVTDSASEPVTLSEVKTYLRIDGTDYDDILTPLIKTVRLQAEKYTGRDFINKTWKTYLDEFPYCSDAGIKILKSKLQSITSIQYYDNNNALQTLSSSDYYITDNSNYSVIYINSSASYPDTYDRKQAAIITFVSGYGATASDVPQDLKQAMLAHISYLFENTGDCTDSSVMSQYMNLYIPYIIPEKLVDFI